MLNDPLAISRSWLARLALSSMALLSATTLASAHCYPGTDSEPLEPTMVLETTGGTFWESFRKAVVEPFEAECGVKVTMTLSPQRNIGQLRGFVARGNVPWDMGLINNPWDFDTALRENLMEPLPPGFWDPIKDKLIPGSYTDYSVWSNVYATQLIYNTKVFADKVPQNWADFWDVETFPGPRSLQDNVVNIVIALLADGLSKDEIYPITDEKLKRAFAKLDKLRPHIRSFWTAGDQPIQGVNRGDFVMSSGHTSRIFAGIRSGYNIGTTFNQGVTTESILYRPRGAKSPRAAAALLFFYNREAQQAKRAELTGYTGALANPGSFVPPELAKNLVADAENIKLAVPLDKDWWGANAARIQGLWKEWVTSGKVSIGTP